MLVQFAPGSSLDIGVHSSYPSHQSSFASNPTTYTRTADKHVGLGQPISPPLTRTAVSIAALTTNSEALNGWNTQQVMHGAHAHRGLNAGIMHMAHAIPQANPWPMQYSWDANNALQYPATPDMANNSGSTGGRPNGVSIAPVYVPLHRTGKLATSFAPLDSRVAYTPAPPPLISAYRAFSLPQVVPLYAMNPTRRWAPNTHGTMPQQVPGINPNAKASRPAVALNDGGTTSPVDVGFEGERQWLEFFPKYGGLGVRATKPIPRGRYIAKKRTDTVVEGVPGPDHFMRVNDAAFEKGLPRAAYEARQSLCNCVAQGVSDGTFLVATRDIFPGEALSLHYGAQFWYEGRPYSNPPEGTPSRPW